MIAVESHGSRLLCSMQLCVNEYLQSHKNHYRKREIGLALLQYYHIDTDCKVCKVERECMCGRGCVKCFCCELLLSSSTSFSSSLRGGAVV